jgi:hypothetical protein
MSSASGFIYCHDGKPSLERNPEQVTVDQCLLWRFVTKFNKDQEIKEFGNCSFVHHLESNLHNGNLINQSVAPLHQIRNSIRGVPENGTVQALPTGDKIESPEADSQ